MYFHVIFISSNDGIHYNFAADKFLLQKVNKNKKGKGSHISLSYFCCLRHFHVNQVYSIEILFLILVAIMKFYNGASIPINTRLETFILHCM